MCTQTFVGHLMHAIEARYLYFIKKKALAFIFNQKYSQKNNKTCSYAWIQS